MIDLRKRPMCWLAIGFLLIICVLMLGRSGMDAATGVVVSWDNESFDSRGRQYNLKDNEVLDLEGTVVSKEYKESVYGGYWQIVIKDVRVEASEVQLREVNVNGRRNRKDASHTLLDAKERDGVSNGRMMLSLEGKYLCQITDEQVDLKIGQRVLLKGKYSPWESPTNEGQFDSKKYYVSQGILGQFKKGIILKTGDDFSLLRENMWRLRQRMQEYLVSCLGSENGGLIGAMLLGDKSDLDEDNKSLYQRNGISHILAISGLHLSLLGMGLYKILLKIMPGKIQAAYICIIIMSLYCVFTGNSISTIRATIMFVLSLVATILGRSYDSLSALGFTAIIQLFMNPYVLDNSGFLLSFLAVIGVTFLSPRLLRLFSCKKNWEKSLCVSLSATLTTLPVVIVGFGTYPWYSVFLNLLILPAMSALLVCAILLLVVSGGDCEGVFLLQEIMTNGNNVWEIFQGFLVSIIRCVIQGILAYFEFCCRVFEKLVLQEGYIGAPGWLVIVLYGILLLAVMNEKLVPSEFLRMLLLVCAVGILTMRFYVGLEVTMLDVGQGDGLVIRNSNGNVYLSDCGSSSVSKVGKYRLVPFLKHKGYGKIKGIFLSHMDEDHMNGIVELLEMALQEHIIIEYIFLPESVLGMEEDRQALEELELSVANNHAELVYLSQGEPLIDGDLHFTCLYPERGLVPNDSSMEKSNSGNGEEASAYIYGSAGANRNNSSLVLLMQYQEFDMLLTGDVEEAGEWDIVRYMKQVRNGNKAGSQLDTAHLSETEEARSIRWMQSKEEELAIGDIDVLKVAHHGSSGSTCTDFLEAFNPKLSLISCGKNNSYGHPHEKTLERLEKSGSSILTTVDCGMITIKVRGKRVRVDRFLE